MTQPDEGLIHAWLDGQLPSDEAARVEQLVASDPEWEAAAAEARGLIAASKRILSALDHVPAQVIPAAKPAPRRSPWWLATAAAAVLMVGGSLVVWQRSATTALTPAPAMTGASPPVTVAQQPPASTAPAAEAPKATTRALASAPATPDAAQDRRAESAVRGTVDRETPPPARLRGELATVAKEAAPPAPAVAAEARKDAASIDRVAAKATAEMTAGAAAPASAPVAALAAESAPMQKVGTANSTVANAPATTARRVAQRSAASPSPAKLLLSDVVVTGVAAQEAQRPACYRVVDANQSGGVLMHVVKVDGDTLRLEAGAPKPTLYAWLVMRDRRYAGAMSADASYRGAVTVTATSATCTAP